MSVDYHLIKRKDKHGRYWYRMGVLDAMPGKNGRPKYRAMRSLGIEAKRNKQGEFTKVARDNAHKAARQLLQTDSTLFAAKDSLRDFLETFWDYGKSEYIKGKRAEGRNISAQYAESSKAYVQTYFLPYFEDRGITKLSELNRRNLTEWRNHLYEHGNVKGEAKTITPSTQNKVRQAVFTALQWAVDMEMLPYHPGQGVRRVASKPAERRIFERSELGKLFSVQWTDKRAYAACLLAAETGMRLGEVRGLQWANVHLEAAYVDVLTNYVDYEGLKEPKWDSKRVGVAISPRCGMALKDLKDNHRWGATDSAFVFYAIDSDRRPMSKEAITLALQKAMKAAEIPTDRTFHCLRHSWITHATGQLPAHLLQRMAGHSQGATTERYQHVSDEHRKALADYASNIIQFEKAK